MRRLPSQIRTLFTLVLLFVAFSSPALAAGDTDQMNDAPDAVSKRRDTTPTGNEEYLSDSHRHELYRQGRLSYSRAALLTAALPGLGNFYARQYFLGGLNMSTVGFSAVLIPYGVVTDQSGFIWTGVGLVGAGYISGFATSYAGVRKFNRQLRRELRIAAPRSTVRTDDGRRSPWQTDIPTLSISIRFR